MSERLENGCIACVLFREFVLLESIGIKMNRVYDSILGVKIGKKIGRRYKYYLLFDSFFLSLDDDA